jgi:hypothetical protein
LFFDLSKFPFWLHQRDFTQSRLVTCEVSHNLEEEDGIMQKKSKDGFPAAAAITQSLKLSFNLELDLGMNDQLLDYKMGIIYRNATHVKLEWFLGTMGML